MVQGFCPLKVKITQLPGGFRLNRSDDVGARFTLGNNFCTKNSRIHQRLQAKPWENEIKIL